MKPLLATSLCPLLLLSVVVLSGEASGQEKPTEPLITKFDENNSVQYLKKFGWNFQGPGFGGSFPNWAQPGTYKHMDFFVQGVGRDGLAFVMRIQRHPKMTKADAAYAQSLSPHKLDMTIFAQEKWGFELNRKFELGSGKSESALREEMEAFLKAALPIVKRLNGNKL